MKIQKGERLGQSHIARKRGSWTRGERDRQMLGMVRVHGACRNSFAGARQPASAGVSVDEWQWMGILRPWARASFGKQTLMPLTPGRLK